MLSADGIGKIPQVVCTHEARRCVFCHADKLTPDDIALNFNIIYGKPNKVEQDQGILHLMTLEKAKRRRARVKDAAARKDRNLSVKYNLLTVDLPNKLPVCKATFLQVLGECSCKPTRFG